MLLPSEEDRLTRTGLDSGHSASWIAGEVITNRMPPMEYHCYRVLQALGSAPAMHSRMWDAPSACGAFRVQGSNFHLFGKTSEKLKHFVGMFILYEGRCLLMEISINWYRDQLIQRLQATYQLIQRLQATLYMLNWSARKVSRNNFFCSDHDIIELDYTKYFITA